MPVREDIHFLPPSVPTRCQWIIRVVVVVVVVVAVVVLVDVVVVLTFIFK